MKFFIMSFLLISSSALGTYRNMALDPADAFYRPVRQYPVSPLRSRSLAGEYDDYNYRKYLALTEINIKQAELQRQIDEFKKSFIDLTPARNKSIIRCLKHPCPYASFENDSIEPIGSFRRETETVTPRNTYVPELDNNQDGPTELSQEL